MQEPQSPSQSCEEPQAQQCESAREQESPEIPQFSSVPSKTPGWQKVWMFFFVVWNVAVPLYTIVALYSMSGLSPFDTSYQAYNYLVNLFNAIFLIACALFLGLVIYLACRLLPNCKDWWSLCVAYERLLESKRFKVIFLLGCLAMFVIQIDIWHTCYKAQELKDLDDMNYITDCKLDRWTTFETNTTTVPELYFTQIQRHMVKLRCFDVKPIFPRIPEAKTMAEFYNFEQSCFEMSNSCKIACSDASSVWIFSITLLASLFGCWNIFQYDGPANDDIPCNIQACTKLRIPYLWNIIPQIWIGSADLVRSLPIMIQLHQTTANIEEYVNVMSAYADLPWDWLEDYKYEELSQLRVLLPRTKSTMSVRSTYSLVPAVSPTAIEVKTQ